MNELLTEASILKALPAVLANDPELESLAASLAAQLNGLCTAADTPRIYPRLDVMPEAVIDMLAYDFKVDWYSYDYPLKDKRETLKGSWYVHKHLGTTSAVEMALGAIYPGTVVTEWYDYGGKPFHFKILIPVDTATLDADMHAKVLSLINFYKNLRSVLDSVEYTDEGGTATVYLMAAPIGVEIHTKTDAAAPPAAQTEE